MFAVCRYLKRCYRSFSFLADRWIYSPVFSARLDSMAANAWIYSAVSSRRPVLVGRLGHVEARLIGETRYRNSRFSPKTLRESHRNAGIFPVERSSLSAAGLRLGEALAEVDLLGFWLTEYQAQLVASLQPMPALCPLPLLEPWWQSHPWSRALAGLRVLVVHPFVTSINSQYQRRERLFCNPLLLPSFDLITFRPPETLGYATMGFSSWTQALDATADAISDLEFDVALLGCGAYGLPLAASIKRMGRPAIHLGGALQLLFGIRGKRWDGQPAFEALMNDHWCRPHPSEVPSSANLVEGGCYW